MATVDTAPIYKASSDCLQAFQKCLRNSNLDSYEDQLGRFNLWAANINAFSSSRTSLDNRLKGSDGTRNMIVQLLQALRINLEYCKISIYLRCKSSGIHSSAVIAMNMRLHHTLVHVFAPGFCFLSSCLTKIDSE